MGWIDPRTRPWWTLIGACSGLFLLMLDSTVVALALSSIKGDLGASATELQWVMNGYLLTIAVLVVTAGRLGDMLGRKRLFVVGMVLFGVGSVLSGAAQGPLMLIAGRVLQGVGAAPMLSLSLAIVCNAFPAEEQPWALGIWAAVSAIALAIGPVVGGCLIALDWRLIFWINLPIVAAGLAIVVAAAPESTDPGAGRHLDMAGLAALMLGLGGLVLAMIQSREWAAGLTAALAAFGVVALAAFGWVERRVRNPIVEFSLFRNGPYFGASAAAFAVVGSYWAVMFFQPQYLQDARGHSAILSGLMILPVTAPMVFISPFSGRLIGRFGARGLMTAGMLCAVVGLVVLTQVGPDCSYVRSLVGYLLFGIAIGLVYAPMSTGGDGGDAGGEGRHRLGRAGDGQDRRRFPGSRSDGCRLPRHAGLGRLPHRIDRRLHLGLGRTLHARRRSHLGLRPRSREAHGRNEGASPSRTPPSIPPLARICGAWVTDSLDNVHPELSTWD
jgi:EmrB/QacA subfamily drug resistance transporter